ncbi:nucleotide-binding protein [Nonomuraea turcica]|uniref:nucleotide-binding protein n=1 Tax=Nonomuraea sp. G32 TaxID=3067274 RepID=UPI00273C3B4C|nr:nucleotide-binding protein [Nonomuraea sp. G32]MDP4511350.1 nucleotide-binding protein [Nonomuraea sp. G32]
MGHNYGVHISGGEVNAQNIAGGPGAHAGSGELGVAGRWRDAQNLQEKERNVFVIHGRDEEFRKRIFDLLRRMDLNPLEWETMVHALGHSSPYLGEVLDQAFTMMQAALVLMTPDDMVRLHPDLAEGERDRVTECQPRPNVLFEAGMAFAKCPERTVILHAGHMRAVSDFGGRNYVTFDGSVQCVNKLKLRLQTAGCAVRETGSDYLDTEQLRNLGAYLRRPRG